MQQVWSASNFFLDPVPASRCTCGMAALRASLRLRLLPLTLWKRYTAVQGRTISASSWYAARKKETDPGLRLDYPELPWRSAQELPPTGWWDDQDRRNKETIVSGCGWWVGLNILTF